MCTAKLSTRLSASTIFEYQTSNVSRALVLPGKGGGGRGVHPYKRPVGMCRWMGSRFHGWIAYNGVTFLVELLEWDRTFSG